MKSNPEKEYANISATPFDLELTTSTTLSEVEKSILEYIRKAKRSRKTVWLSEAIESLGIDPHEALVSAKRLEERGLIKPKNTM